MGPGRTALGGLATAVVVMAKRPAPGSTKTRLTPYLSPAEAAELYECLLLDTLDRLAGRKDCDVVIAIDEAASADYFRGVAPDAPLVVQAGTTLGHRLDVALGATLALGYRQVFAIGSDSPDLPSGHLDEAFAQLTRDDVDVVLGPTLDGGYYLIGWKRPWSPLVTEVAMSTPTVLADTLAAAERVGARVRLAPSWYDVDEPPDLAVLQSSLDGAARLALERTAGFLDRVTGR